MTLHDWLQWQEMSEQKFAKDLRVDVALVRSWASGRAKPQVSDMTVIDAYTRGLVSSEDWP